MSFQEIMGWFTVLLQFIVAGYALRLNRIFGTARVGWSLFWAFSLLALLHSAQSVMSFNNGVSLGIETEVIYSLISLLLLTSLVHIETLLRERLRVEQEEKRMQDGLEFMVKEKTAHMTQAVEDLRLEIAERKRVEAEVERTKKEILTASRRAGMAEISKLVLNNIESIHKSVNASTALIADQVMQSKISDVIHIGRLLCEHESDGDKFLAQDPRRQKLPVYIAQLAQHLAEERAALSTELDFIRKNIEHLKAVVVMEQNCAKMADKSTASGAATFIEATILNNPLVVAQASGQN